MGLAVQWLLYPGKLHYNRCNLQKAVCKIKENCFAHFLLRLFSTGSSSSGVASSRARLHHPPPPHQHQDPRLLRLKGQNSKYSSHTGAPDSPSIQMKETLQWLRQSGAPISLSAQVKKRDSTVLKAQANPGSSSVHCTPVSSLF
jgi:hypothetical protein